MQVLVSINICTYNWIPGGRAVFIPIFGLSRENTTVEDIVTESVVDIVLCRLL